MDSSVAIEAVLDKLPVAELEETLSDFIAPFTAVLPDARLRQVVPLLVRGSENREIHRAIREVFPEQWLRFVGDSGLDCKKIFDWIAFEAEAS